MKLVQFENGSFSLQDELTGETFHSRAGAYTEAFEVYWKQSGLLELFSQKNRVVLYDIGLGTGMNVCVTLDHLVSILKQSPTTKDLIIYSFEKDVSSLALVLETLNQSSPKNELPFQELRSWQNALETILKTKSFSQSFGSFNYSWRLIEGDFFTLKSFHTPELPPPDVIYYDFFSPKVAPSFWGYEAIQYLSVKKSENLRLITYVASTAFRSALLLNGFWVAQGIGTPAKKETTVAGFGKTPHSLKKNLLSLEWEKKLTHSSHPLPNDLPFSKEVAFQKIKNSLRF